MGSNMDKIYIVMNYVEHDLKSLMETMKQPFLPGRALRPGPPEGRPALRSPGAGVLTWNADPVAPRACGCPGAGKLGGHSGSRRPGGPATR